MHFIKVYPGGLRGGSIVIMIGDEVAAYHLRDVKNGSAVLKLSAVWAKCSAG